MGSKFNKSDPCSFIGFPLTTEINGKRYCDLEVYCEWRATLYMEEKKTKGEPFYLFDWAKPGKQHPFEKY